MSTETRSGESKELPKYKSHKKVWSLIIAAIAFHKDGVATITPGDEGYGQFTTEPGYEERYKGTNDDLGRYVRYQDGYESWSPTAAFDDGYTPSVDGKEVEISAELLEKLNDIVEKQDDNCEEGPDEYFRGMYNGMEVLMAAIEKCEPCFRPTPDDLEPEPPELSCESYQGRVKQEKQELDEKFAALDTFIHSDGFKTVPTHERQRLIKQHQHMNGYSKILAERIKEFGS